MWRAFFMAIGITLCILGGECLLIDKAVLEGLTDEEDAELDGLQAEMLAERKRVAPLPGVFRYDVPQA